MHCMALALSLALVMAFSSTLMLAFLIDITLALHWHQYTRIGGCFGSGEALALRRHFIACCNRVMHLRMGPRRCCRSAQPWIGCTASYAITFSSRLAEELSQQMGCSWSRPTLNQVASDCLHGMQRPDVSVRYAQGLACIKEVLQMQLVICMHCIQPMMFRWSVHGTACAGWHQCSHGLTCRGATHFGCWHRACQACLLKLTKQLLHLTAGRRDALQGATSATVYSPHSCLRDPVNGKVSEADIP